MAKFLTIAYGDQKGYEQTPIDLRNRAFERDKALLERGALVGVAEKPVQVRNTEFRGLEVTENAYMSSQLPVAGFAVIEAKDLAEAIDLVSETPCATMHGVVEVWPMKVADNGS
jgi:hypothetical protein